MYIRGQLQKRQADIDIPAKHNKRDKHEMRYRDIHIHRLIYLEAKTTQYPFSWVIINRDPRLVPGYLGGFSANIKLGIV